MEETEKMLEELHALNTAAQMAREELCLKSIRLADEVVRCSLIMGDIRKVDDEEIRAYIEADERYSKAVDEATASAERLSLFLETDPRGGAL